MEVGVGDCDGLDEIDEEVLEGEIDDSLATEGMHCRWRARA